MRRDRPGAGGPGRRQGEVALVTGGANGIGTAVARRLAARGAAVVVADIDAERGQDVAREVDGAFVRCDVAVPEDSAAAVTLAVERFGGLDVVFLNAGVATAFGLGEDFDPAAYRRVMGVNLDGVVYGAHAALPALRARGGGHIVATASIAGLTSVPFDPLYAANKHAVVGLVRSLGPAVAADGIRVNALCPSFARTGIIGPIEQVLREGGVPVLDVADVAEAFLAILDADSTGECWFVVPGRAPAPFQFRGIPGPRPVPVGRPGDGPIP